MNLEDDTDIFLDAVEDNDEAVQEMIIEATLPQGLDSRHSAGDGLSAMLVLLMGWMLCRRRRGQQHCPEDASESSEASDTESEEIQCGELMAMEAADLFA